MKCPSCGFVFQKKRADCAKCGIVFGKIKSGRQSQPTVLMATKIPYDADGLFPKLIYPLAIAKIYVETVYCKMLGLIWDELFKGKRDLNQTGNFIAFLVFCVFSLLMYHIDDYVGYVIAALAAVWFLDMQLARYKYRNGERNEFIRLLKSPRGKIILRKSNPDGEVEFEVELTPSEVNHLSISQVERKGGAFQETVATVWQSSLSFNDESKQLFSEDNDLSRALKKVRYLSKLLRVKFHFEHSQNVEPATQSIRGKNAEDDIKVEAKNNRFKISTRWTSNMRLRFIALILRESGFFLFLLIVAGVMIKFGGLLIFLYDRFYGSGMASVNMEFNFIGIISVFEPDTDPVDIVEYAAAVTLLMRKTLLLARPQHVTIDSATTRYYVNENLEGECKTAAIDHVSLLTSPEPTIVLSNPDSSIVVKNLKSMQEFKSFFQKIREVMEKFKATSIKKSTNAAPRIEMSPDL